MNSACPPTAVAEKPPRMVKADASLPLLIVTGPSAIAIRAYSVADGRVFAEETRLPIAPDTLEPGVDYVVSIQGGEIVVEPLLAAPIAGHIAGFHFAPGGNAAARAGGDAVPAINPCSLWDLNFRPACDDPRGMALITSPTVKPFWCDIYLAGVDHLTRGTSTFGASIANGNNPPIKLRGDRCAKFDYATAVAVLAHHGKQPLALDEFFAAAYGVTEKTAAGSDPKITGLDAPRTSRFGLMQATGNVWVWGHDGDPDEPRASIFGGSWRNGGDAGSRYASVGYWPGLSVVNLGARGRCDHLQLD
jgi:hypothetical protein